jgi:hypothetical protein
MNHRRCSSFLVGFTNYTPAEIKSAVDKLAGALLQPH